MTQYFFKLSLSLILLSSFAFAKSKLYVLPQDAQQSQKKILQLIKKSKKNIKIAMYNLKYKKFIKALKKAHKNGINIDLYLDKDKASKKRINFIEYKTFNKKLHIKAVLFDDKTVVFGSANWKKESFDTNMEIIYITDEVKIVKEFKAMFKQLSKQTN
jgi:phosphatidylserine/phosphatidylglycerophosphate/cardiolipin synthase-like enzyme